MANKTQFVCAGTNIVLERMKIVCLQRMSEECVGLMNVSCDVSSHADFMTDDILLRIKGHIMAEKVQDIRKTIQWPATWWDAVKERFFPRWLLRRYPVMHYIEHVELVAYATLPKCTLIPEDKRGPIVWQHLDRSWTETDGEGE